MIKSARETLKTQRDALIGQARVAKVELGPMPIWDRAALPAWFEARRRITKMNRTIDGMLYKPR